MLKPRRGWRNIHWPRVTRDTVLFVSGLLGILHETVIADSERPTLLFAFMAMVGLPAFLRADEKRSDREADPRRRVDGRED